MLIFTSISLNYLPKARILAHTLKRFHPDWELHLIISDRISDRNQSSGLFDFRMEPFDKVLWIDEFNIPDLKGWLFKHTVVEVCTAIKGIYIDQLAKGRKGPIIYLDPDIAVFNPLSPLVNLLNDHAILLTPHLLAYPETPDSIRDNEIMGVMKHGVFNLGFFAVDLNKTEGRRFSNWWGHRLMNYCYADFAQNLFTDQKWCDLVPAYFQDVAILHDPGYNVASWNLDKRVLSFNSKGQVLINQRYPLRFYHFTGYDSGAGNAMTERYGAGNPIVKEIWNWYGQKLQDYGQARLGNIANYYGYFDNGQPISSEARALYRRRQDLQDAFPDPYLTSAGTGGYFDWYQHNQ